ETLRHFEHEFLAMTKLLHPNLVAVHDFGTVEISDEPGRRLPFFTMELIEGKTIEKHFAAPVDFSALYRIVAGVVRALAYLHSRGLVHRDVKSSNILVTMDSAGNPGAEGSTGQAGVGAVHDPGSSPRSSDPAQGSKRPQAKLMDFGLIDTAQTAAGPRIQGTVSYLAPEMARGGRIDPRADLYSLGIVLYEIVTGRLPFRGHSPLSVIRGHLEEPPLPPSTLNSSVPQGLEEIILRCLEKEPSARFASASELLEAFSKLAGEELNPDSPEIGRSYILSGRFVGRDREMEALRGCIGEAEKERGRLVLVGGEAGTGKSRLLREFRVWCQVHDIPFFLGRCYESPVVPYGPIIEVLDALVRRWEDRLDEPIARHGPALAALLPRLAERPSVRDGRAPAPLGPEEERLRLVSAASDFLVAAAAQGPYVLAVEDLNWADEASCDLLRVLGRNLLRGGGRVLLAGSYRDDELSRTSPLFELLVDGREEGYLADISLRGLNPQETELLVGSMLGAPPSDQAFTALARRVHDETRGNPFFIEELMTLLVDEGVVTPGQGRPPAESELEVLEVPRRTRDALARRLARLDAESLDLLQAASVIGGAEASLRALAEVVARPVEELHGLLASLTRTNLLDREIGAEGEIRYRPAQTAIAKVASEGMDPQRRTAFHRRYAEHLEGLTRPVPEERFGLLALHFMRAELPGRAIDYLVRAADRAARLHANREALALYGQTIDLLARGRVPVAGGTLSELYEKRGNLQELLGEFERADEDYQWMLARAEKDADEHHKARAYLDIGNVLAHRSEYEKSLESYGKALAIHRRVGAQQELAESLRLIGRIHARLGNYAEAHDHFSRSLDIARKSSNVMLLVRNLTDQGFTHREQGQIRESLRCFGEAHEAVQRAEDRRGLAAVIQGLALCHDFQGRYGEAVARYQESLAISREIGDIQMVASTATHLGALFCRMGEHDQGMRLFDESLDITRRIGTREGVIPNLHSIAALHLSQGRYEKALEVAEEALRTARRIGKRDDAAIALNTIGAVYMRVGDYQSAGRCLEEAQRIMREIRSQRWLAVFLTDLAEFRLATDQPEKAREHFKEACFIARRIGDRRRETVGMIGLAESYLRGKDFDRAAAACRKGLTLVEESRLKKQWADGLALRSRIEIERPGGDLVAASADLRQALAIAGELKDTDLTWQAQHLMGKVLFRLGDRAEAEGAYRSAFLYLDGAYNRLPEKWRRTFYRDPRRRAFSLEWERLKIRPSERPSEAVSGGLAAFEKLRKDYENLTRLLEINKKLNSTLQHSVLLRTIIDTAIELTGAERGFLILSRPDGMVFEVARTARGEEVPEPERGVSRSIAQMAVREGRPLLTTDAREDPRFSASASVHQLQLRSVVAIPLRQKGEAAGAIYLDSRLSEGIFNEEHQRLLTLFADQAGIALENARLYDEAESRGRQIELLNRELERTVAEQREEIAGVREQLADLHSSIEMRYHYDNIIGKSRPMQAVYAVLDKVMDSRIPVLITGESGTGKELIAKALHFNGPRKKERLMTVNCAAFTETLLDSELFGYKRGAFTGADRDRKGILELAHKGTLALDEIGDMPLSMQSKLLRALQEGEVLPIGGKEVIRVDVRVIAVTNRDLRQRIAEGLFREDLFYRLNVANIHIAPLRERREDIPLLIEHFLEKIAAEEGKPRKNLDGAALRLLLAYDWPGNIRELEHEVLKLVTFSTGTVIGEREVRDNSGIFQPPIVRQADASSGAQGGPINGEPGEEAKTLKESERRQILRALETAGGNRTLAARILGINRATLFRKLKRLELPQ
ncbi:MAG: hypothetical protein DMF49_06975, partial [Acidobacteria bacterium]